MIRSMTGYGSASAPIERGTLTVEARSVNSRGLKLVVRGPLGSEAWEAELRDLVGGRVQRGRIDLAITVQEDGSASSGRRLDEARIRDLLLGLERLRREFDVPGEPDLALLVQMGGLFRENDGSGQDETVPFEAVRGTAGRALDGLIEMRQREGGRLEQDLRARIAALRDGAGRIEALAPERLARERERLCGAVRDLAGGVELDPDRLEREIALIADRWSIDE
ncbi:MAG: YicC/YloC family endoribonuclease, partial [Gemmatimonadota bacterium]